MKCRKCKADLPAGAKFCPMCGAKQDLTRKPKNRGNGTGSVYMRGKTWMCTKTISYSVDGDLRVHRRTISKGGFKTKREAIEYLPKLTEESQKKKSITLAQAYDAWYDSHDRSQSTMDCYQAAFKRFAPLHHVPIEEIDIDDLQECMDECELGKQSKQNAKTLIGLLYKWAIPRHYVTLNLGPFIKVRAESGKDKQALPMEAVQRLMEAHSVPYADYIVAQCYLGFRPSELLALDAKDYDRVNRAFIGGAKTDAGRDRIVTISPKIQAIVDRLTKDKISGQVFCREDGGNLTIEVYRQAFYNALEAIGIDNPVEDGRHKYTPHSCRHTFATMLKRIEAPDKDKLRLIGHTSDAMLRYYQDANIEDLRKITDAI